MDYHDIAFRNWCIEYFGVFPENSEARAPFAAAFIAGSKHGLALAQKAIHEANQDDE